MAGLAAKQGMESEEAGVAGQRRRPARRQERRLPARRAPPCYSRVRTARATSLPRPPSPTSQGPVKVIVTLRRPASIKTGPEVVNTTHAATCGKLSSPRVPARRGNNKAGVLRCTFEAVLPQAALMMEAAEQIMAASVDAEAAAAPAKAAAPLTPDVTVTVVATPAPTSFSSGGPVYTTPAATSPPYKTPFPMPAASCVAVSEALSGPLAKYVLPTKGSSLPARGLRTVCGSTEVTYNARLGGFDASACGAHTLSNGAVAAAGLEAGDAQVANVAITVSGCNRTAFGRPDVTITKLTAARIANSSWNVAAYAVPLVDRAGNLSAAADAKTLQLPAGGAAAANFTLNLEKGAAKDLGEHLMVRAWGWCGGGTGQDGKLDGGWTSGGGSGSSSFGWQLRQWRRHQQAGRPPLKLAHTTPTPTPPPNPTLRATSPSSPAASCPRSSPTSASPSSARPPAT
jgi:hypothetical protein